MINVMSALYNNSQALQLIKSQGQSAFCWSHFHLSVDKRERSGQFVGDVWTARRVPQPLLICIPCIASYSNSSRCWVDIDIPGQILNPILLLAMW